MQAWPSATAASRNEPAAGLRRDANPAHGGALVDRWAPAERREELLRGARALPCLDLHPFECCDLELVANGAYSPLDGFLGSRDFEAVLEHGRLATGVLWPIPIVLARDRARLGEIRPGDTIALRAPGARIVALLGVREIFPHDRRRHAERIYGTSDPAHPGVARVLGTMGDTCVGGEIELLESPLAALALVEESHPLCIAPREMREIFRSRDWRRIAAFQTRSIPHRGHEYVTKVALELTDGLLFHPLVGETRESDTPASVRMRCYEALLENYYPRARVLLAAFPAPMRYAGPRESLLHAIARKNFGATHFIVGRDHAGARRADGAPWYEHEASHRLLERLDPSELGIEILSFESAYFDRRSGGVVSARTAPDGAEREVLSGTDLRAMLARGESPPETALRPEVGRVLLDWERSRRPRPAPAAMPEESAPPARRAAHGVCLWLTGIPSSGKTTVARGIAATLRARGRLVEVLDGDEVRRVLSPDLGYSAADRDLHVHRLGYLCQLLVRNGVVAIGAAVSPYRRARDANRERIGRFVEVFLRCPVAVAIARDPKGHYRRALAGEIAHFTGVSDPYEEPLAPEIVLDTDRHGAEECVSEVVRWLDAGGWL